MIRRGQRRIEWRPGAGEERDAVLHVRVLGSAPTPLVLLHGLTASNRSWGADFDTLAGSSTVVVPDLLGFGASPKPPTGYGPDAHADSLARCLEALGLPGRAIVVGHSLGALVALRFARRHPNSVARVVAIAPPIYRDQTDARRRIAALGPLARFFALDTPWARRACAVMCRYRPAAARLASWIRPGVPAELARSAVEHTWASYSQTLEQVILAGGAHTDVAACPVPVRVLAGTHDEVIDLVFLDELANTCSHASVSRVGGGGHDLLLTHAACCVAIIRDEIAALEAERDGA